MRIAAQNEGSYSVEQVARIWSHVRGHWRYVNDPRGTSTAHASASIENDYIGDCDDFSIVLVSMIQATGGDARLVMMDGPQGGSRLRRGVRAGTSDEVRDKLAAHYRRNLDSNLGRQRIQTVHFRPGHDCGVWLNLDWNAGVRAASTKPSVGPWRSTPTVVPMTLAPAGAEVVPVNAASSAASPSGNGRVAALSPWFSGAGTRTSDPRGSA
ncbi:MAG: transglutaminase-like domain-containing protein [Polyangiales bacterium]